MKWIYNYFMYIRFGGMRNTKNWIKSTPVYDNLLQLFPLLPQFKAFKAKR